MVNDLRTVQCTSLKANVGHAEAAAAAVGLISLILLGVKAHSVYQNAALRVLNVHLSSLVAARGSRSIMNELHIPVELVARRDWRMLSSIFSEAIESATEEPAVGRISSFGFSGTIAHGLIVHGCTNSYVRASAVAHDGSALEAA